MAKIFTFLYTFRIDKKTHDALEESFEKRRDKYSTKSQLIRCAIIELNRNIRGEEERWMKKQKKKSTV